MEDEIHCWCSASVLVLTFETWILSASDLLEVSWRALAGLSWTTLSPTRSAIGMPLLTVSSFYKVALYFLPLQNAQCASCCQIFQLMMLKAWCTDDAYAKTTMQEREDA